MARNGGITYEPCTLVYTLLDESAVSFDDFELIIRSLHSFMVDSITPNHQMKNVHVKLNYQASTINAQNKLGILQSSVAVTKLSNFVQESEFSKLEQLKRRFNIGSLDGDGSTAVYCTPPRRGRGRGRPPTFAARPPPYKRPTPPKVTEIPDTQECDATGYTYTDPEETRRASNFYIRDSEDHEQQIGE